MSDLSEVLRVMAPETENTPALPREVPCPLVRGTCTNDFCEAPEVRNHYIEKFSRPCHQGGKCVALLIYKDMAADELRVYRYAQLVQERGNRRAERVFHLI